MTDEDYYVDLCAEYAADAAEDAWWAEQALLAAFDEVKAEAESFGVPAKDLSDPCTADGAARYDAFACPCNPEDRILLSVVDPVVGLVLDTRDRLVEASDRASEEFDGEGVYIKWDETTVRGAFRGSLFAASTEFGKLSSRGLFRHARPAPTPRRVARVHSLRGPGRRVARRARARSPGRRSTDDPEPPRRPLARREAGA